MSAAAWWAREPAARALRGRLEAEARERGLVLHIAEVDVGLHPAIRLRGVRVERPGLWSLDAETADITLAGRMHLGAARFAGLAGLTVDAVPTAWQITGVRTFTLREPCAGLTVRITPGAAGRDTEVHADALAAGTVFRIGRAEVPLLDAGRVSGTVRLAAAEAGATTIDLDLGGEDVRVAAFSDDAEADEGRPPSFGPPITVVARLAGSWSPAEHRLAIPRWRLETSGAALSGSLTLADLPADPRLDLALEVERVDFARLLEISALEPPAAVSGAAAGHANGLGSASLSARASGRLLDPSSFTVTQKLDFTPPSRPLPALERLRGPFVHEVVAPGGGVRAIDVSPASPDFIALPDVPALFVETVLLGEDYGFHGHRGIDLSELPAAILKNWSRGGAARGASTITQQLAKNLFLSRDKRLGRKLQELCLALLLEATLDKERILEIYLNVIEWGPDVYGLRPAARRYFGREPRGLTPKQMAFLVALIPGPIKYQRSFASGTLSPGFRPLVDRLLAKLRSVGGLSEEEYQAALAEELWVPPATGPAEVSTR
jgi:transglycosylase-like protein